MKLGNNHKKSIKNILFFSNELHNDSTKKKLNNQSTKEINNKLSVTSFNNSSLVNSRSSLIKVQRKMNRSSSTVNSKPNNSTIFSPCRIQNKKSITNIYYQKNVISPMPSQRKENFKTSIMNNNQIKNKNPKNIIYSPNSPYTPTKSRMFSGQSYSNKSNSQNINNMRNRLNPSSFNPFIIPQKKKENMNNSKIYKHISPQEIFNQRINILFDNVYKEISILVKKLAEINYNKNVNLNEANVSYLKQLKELYDNKEKQMIYVFDKYKYDLNNLKYRKRKKYLEMYKNKAKELMEIEKNFNFEKEQIKISYQMNFDLIKKREEIEIKNLFERKIIEKARNNLLNLIDF